MSRQMRNDKVIGGTSNNASAILYQPADPNRSETSVEAELDRHNEVLSNLTTYSTTEVNTGKTWIDGKPIYRKIIRAVKNQTGTLQIASGIDAIVSYSGLVRTFAGNRVPMPYYDSSGMFISVTVGSTGLAYVISPDNVYGNGTVEVCIEYTKA